MTVSATRLAVVVALAAFAVVGRLALLAVPNVSLSFLVLFVAGVAYGPRVGAGVGLVSRLASDLFLTGLNPILVPMALVDASLGALAGLVGAVFDLGQRGSARGVWPRILLLNLGLLFTVAFSVIADSITWIFYNWILPDAPDVARSALWGTLVAMGLYFSVPSIVFNALLFPVAVPPVLDNLREAGLLPEPGPADDRPPLAPST